MAIPLSTSSTTAYFVMLVFWRQFLSPERLSLSLVLVSLTLVLIHQNWLWRWDQTVYDTHFKLWSRSPPKDLVIIDINAESLAELGSWPWPRTTHASLIDKISDAGANAILFDVVFAEPSKDHPEQDYALSEAIRASGRVILPVLFEQLHHRGQLVETLPIPLLTQAAAGLGHVHVELDLDGIARSVYLLEGFGSPRWPTLSLAALRFLEPDGWQQLPGSRNPNPSSDAIRSLVRDFHIRVPFAGPPGLFPRVSYNQVLRGDIPADFLRDKIILIGTTVSGLSDSLPTPVSGFNQAMPGVEFHANILAALREHRAISSLEESWRILISIGLALIPAIMFPYVSPRTALILAGLLILSAFGISTILLQGFYLWFAPMPVIVSLAFSYPFWSWRRLEYTMRYLNQELTRLHAEPTTLTAIPPPKFTSVMQLIQELFPIDGWVLRDESGQVLEGDGKIPSEAMKPIPGDTWLYDDQVLWTLRERNECKLQLGFHWCGGDEPRPQQLDILTELINLPKPVPLIQARGAAEVVQARIQQVQEATDRLRAMRRLISDSLAEMADGVLITNLFGQVLVANKPAANYLQGQSEENLVGLRVSLMLKKLEMQGELSWQNALERVVSESITTNFYARNESDRDLFIQMARLSLGESHGSGLIINLTDVTPLKESERRRMELLGFLSHDLRSPLVSILALLDLAKERQNFGASNNLLIRIDTYTRSILKFSENFIQLAKAEGPEEIPFYEVDLVNVASNALEQVWPQAVEKQIILDQCFDISEAWFLGEATLIERAIVNLLTNAIKYSPEGSSVELTVGEADAEFYLRVKDNGIGISEEYLPHLFDRFSREKKAILSDTRGYGLGLAFVKAVAKKHHGNISVKSTVGQGSSFCFRIPLPISNNQ